MTDSIEVRVARAEEEIKSRRARSDQAFADVISGSCQYPAVTFTHLNVEEISELVRARNGKVVFVSCHTYGYYLLHNILELCPVKVNCVAAQGSLDFFERIGYNLPSNIISQPTLSKDGLKKVMSGTEAMFVMADVLFPRYSNCSVKLLHKTYRYTVTWAELASRHRLSIVPIFCRYKNDLLEVRMEWIPSGKTSVAELAGDFFERFDEFLDGNTDIWENFPLFREFSFPLLPIDDEMTPKLIRALAYLGMCDLEVAKALKSLVGDISELSGEAELLAEVFPLLRETVLLREG